MLIDMWDISHYNCFMKKTFEIIPYQTDNGDILIK